MSNVIQFPNPRLVELRNSTHLYRTALLGLYKSKGPKYGLAIVEATVKIIEDHQSVQQANYVKEALRKKGIPI